MLKSGVILLSSRSDSRSLVEEVPRLIPSGADPSDNGRSRFNFNLMTRTVWAQKVSDTLYIQKVSDTLYID